MEIFLAIIVIASAVVLGVIFIALLRDMARIDRRNAQRRAAMIRSDRAFEKAMAAKI